MEESKKPALRFKGFHDDWEQRKFNVSFDFLQNNALSRAELSNDGEVMNVHYGDILVKYGEVLDIAQEELTYLQDSSIMKKYQTSLLRNGDVIIADAAEDETVGKCSEIAGLSIETVLSGLHTIPCRPAIKFAEGYLGYYMNSDAYHDQLLPLIQGTKISSISKSAIQDTEIVYPKSEKEQTAISTYFKHLDNLITLHQRKYESLVNIKKAMLEKMFPKNEEVVPELRFAGFTDTWEQRKLSTICSMHARIGWQNLRTSEFLDTGDYYLITGTDFDNGRVNLDNCHYVDKSRYEQDTKIQIQNGSILITKDGTLGKVAFVEGLDKPATLNAGVFNVEITKNFVDNKYLFQYLKAPFLMDYVDKKATGGTIKHLNQNILVDFPIAMPKVEEQRLIGEYFSHLDHLITLHQRELEKLQNIKKSCLEKMFI